ncbi:hypothetical protein HMPREF1624_07032 [Sporothrix schenckii ATCC 58251]|uniref:MEI5 protein n=1 Tax=Sporothrix schenckii (strain ATCC 58251 / de Perez 2211183) TaxID=1391915 RepID=U7PME8_SPOS1|nr:hypothetical protein HMPREF1624_07032 [Sporothrix schenckii ATCC 58251]
MASPNGLNGTLAVLNAPSNGTSPPSPPLQTIELSERLSTLQQSMETLWQNRNVFKDVEAVLSDNKNCQGALRASMEHFHQVKAENDNMQSQIASQGTTIRRLEGRVEELRKKAAIKDRDLKIITESNATLKSEATEEKKKIEALLVANDTLTRDKKSLEGKLSQQSAQLAKLTAQVETLKTQHHAKVGELKRQLDTLNSYAIPIHNLPLQDASAKLDSIFQSAHRLVSGCFATDLPAHVFARDSDDWKAFTSAVGDTNIPLPPSNTLDAKRMRTAAVLRFLAKNAVAKLFQPFYTLEHGSELSDWLHERIDDDEHLNFVRRVLLRAEARPATMDGVQNDLFHAETHAAARAKAVGRALSVRGAVGGILSQEASDAFFVALGRWCAETAETWRTDIQPLRDVFQALLDLDDDELEVNEWRVLPDTPDKDDGNAPSPVLPLDSINDVAAHVWPLFMSNGNVAQCGFVVTKAQVARAKLEVGQFAAMQNNSRRVNRASARRSSGSDRIPSTANQNF